MYEFLEYQVSDAMTYRPVTVTRTTTISEVEALFARHDFNCLPVSEEGGLLGVVTKLDVLRAFAFGTETLLPHYDEIMAKPIETVMTHQPIVVTPDMSLTRVLQTMTETRFRSFPVVIGRLLIGIIARQDVLSALRRAATGELPRSGPRRDGMPHGRTNPLART